MNTKAHDRWCADNIDKVRSYRRKWASNNREYAVRYREDNPSIIRTGRVRHRSKKRSIIIAAKRKPCKDCKLKFHWFVMDFDHVHGTKKFTIGSSTIA